MDVKELGLSALAELLRRAFIAANVFFDFLHQAQCFAVFLAAQQVGLVVRGVLLLENGVLVLFDLLVELLLSGVLLDYGGGSGLALDFSFLEMVAHDFLNLLLLAAHNFGTNRGRGLALELALLFFEFVLLLASSSQGAFGLQRALRLLLLLLPASGLVRPLFLVLFVAHLLPFRNALRKINLFCFFDARLLDGFLCRLLFPQLSRPGGNLFDGTHFLGLQHSYFAFEPVPLPFGHSTFFPHHALLSHPLFALEPALLFFCHRALLDGNTSTLVTCLR